MQERTEKYGETGRQADMGLSAWSGLREELFWPVPDSNGKPFCKGPALARPDGFVWRVEFISCAKQDSSPLVRILWVNHWRWRPSAAVDQRDEVA
jgi:hypothetical protein